MRFLHLLTVVLLASQVAAAPARVERVPLTHAELHELEAQAREAHPHSSLTARDLHPLTPVLLAELEDSIPAFIVEREVAVNMVQDDPNTRMDTAAERDMDTDDRHLQTAEDAEEDDDALIESEFEISQPYGGYGGFGGGFGGYGGFGKKGGIGYKKVPYKKVPYKKVPFKKGPPKKKLPPKKKFPPKKKGGFGFGGYGGFGGGYGGGFGGHH